MEKKERENKKEERGIFHHLKLVFNKHNTAVFKNKDKGKKLFFFFSFCLDKIICKVLI